MKKGFTMIELIFVIVILGILAAVAIPRLAATRDDATLAGIKTDVSTAMQAVPAWYQGQKDARIAQGVQLDTAKWIKANTGEVYTWSDGGAVCVTLALHDMNDTDGVLTDNGLAEAGTDYNATSGYWLTGAEGVPVLQILKGTGTLTTVCDTLWASDGLALTEQNITMAGKKVQW